jgi:hypothetical protein
VLESFPGNIGWQIPMLCGGHMSKSDYCLKDAGADDEIGQGNTVAVASAIFCLEILNIT